jgi:hypothetical protein
MIDQEGDSSMSTTDEPRLGRTLVPREPNSRQVNCALGPADWAVVYERAGMLGIGFGTVIRMAVKAAIRERTGPFADRTA